MEGEVRYKAGEERVIASFERVLRAVGVSMEIKKKLRTINPDLCGYASETWA